MGKGISRRQAITIGSAGLLSLAGCLGSESRYPVPIHLINSTDTEHDVFISLVEPQSGETRDGRQIVSSESSVEKVVFNELEKTFEVKAVVDDTIPIPTGTTKLEVTENTCENTVFWLLSQDQEDISIRSIDMRCD